MTDRVRGFPAFPPQRRRGRHSWWGNAWIEALEDSALDSIALRQGRAFAHTGQVGSITVSPGRLSAVVAETYQTRVFVEQLGERDWQRLLELVAAKAGHVAALLDRDMPHELVEEALDVGVRLLPDMTDLQPECGCPDWGFPCRHAAALCYQTAWLLDADPFVLLLLRGRGEGELLDELRRRVTPPPPVTALDLLVANAAARARDLLAGDSLPLTEEQDLVRLAATVPGARERLVADDRAVLAWQQGGAAGLDTLAEPWTPPKATVARAAAALSTEDLPEVAVWRNRWTISDRGVQVRYGRDGRWYPYRTGPDGWWPAGPPERDPAAALTELLADG